MTQASTSVRPRIFHPALVWTLRILVGATFIISGFIKGVDPWGSCIKIGEYFDAWGWSIPSAFITIASFLLAGYEFIWGTLLFFGCYKRISTWALTLMMAFLLPLTLYIALFSPVDDCGCFGDFIILSNWATFIKNIFITAALIYLCKYNSLVDGLFIPYIQWVIGGIVTLYILAVELFGYNVQPLLDFRRFNPGTELLDGRDDSSSETIYEYIYEKDGRRESFHIEDLPDSTWTYVDRTLISGEENTNDGFVIIDDEGDDITEDIIDPDVEQLIVTVPDISKVDLSCTYLINELNDFISSRGGSLVALINADSDGISWWKDISMADYPIYQADPKLLKELARGNAALILLDHGKVEWKRTLSSISYTFVTETPASTLLSALDPDTEYVLKLLTIPYVGLLSIILILDRSGKLLAWHIRRGNLKRKSSVEKP